MWCGSVKTCVHIDWGVHYFIFFKNGQKCRLKIFASYSQFLFIFDFGIKKKYVFTSTLAATLNQRPNIKTSYFSK